MVEISKIVVFRGIICYGLAATPLYTQAPAVRSLKGEDKRWVLKAALS